MQSERPTLAVGLLLCGFLFDRLLSERQSALIQIPLVPGPIAAEANLRSRLRPEGPAGAKVGHCDASSVPRVIAAKANASKSEREAAKRRP